MAGPRSPARAGAAAALCALALLCCSTAAASASNVLVLNGDASFDAALAAHDFLVVDFYAPVRLLRGCAAFWEGRHVSRRIGSPSAACVHARKRREARVRRWWRTTRLCDPAAAATCGGARARTSCTAIVT